MRSALGAVILAGGRGSRLGGAAKPLLARHGRSLLATAVDAARTAGAEQFVVVGPSVLPLPDDVVLVQEDPPFGGPAAAVAAGVAVMADGPSWVLVLAADLLAPEAAVAALRSRVSAATADAVIGVDATGRRQYLLALYRRSALAAAASAAGDLTGVPIRRLVDGLMTTEVRLPDSWVADVDTPAQLRDAGLELAPRRPGRGGAAVTSR